MSVQDPIAFPVNGTPANVAKAGTGFWRHMLLASIFCFVVVLAWSSQVVNVVQIVAVAVALSVGLNARAVMKLDEVDVEGLGGKLPLAETTVGIAIVAALATVSMIAASSIVAPLDGVLQFALFACGSAGVFCVAMALESAVSVLACYALKPLLSKSPIGAEIAVMLNLQQKYQTQLV